MMPPFLSTARTIGSLMKSSKKFNEIRCSSGCKSVLGRRDLIGGVVQTRPFLGCGDGEEGGVLSKVYEEKRVLG